MAHCRDTIRRSLASSVRLGSTIEGIMETLGMQGRPAALTFHQTAPRIHSRTLQGPTISWASRPSQQRCTAIDHSRTVLPVWAAPQTSFSPGPRYARGALVVSSEHYHRRCAQGSSRPQLQCKSFQRRSLGLFVCATRDGAEGAPTASVTAEEGQKQGNRSAALGISEASASPSARKRGYEEAGGDNEALPRGGPERTPSGLLSLVPEAARPIPQQLGVLITTWRQRATSFARESILLIYSALIDNTLVVVLERLKLDKALRKAQPWLERSSARIFGSYHEMPDGRRVPLSMVNNTAPDFSIPGAYNPAELPFGLPRGSGYDPNVAHFMSLCMKAVYEEEEVIQDLGERCWGLKYHGYFSTQTDAASLYDVENNNTADFIPRTRACMWSSRHGLVIAFRGSEPLNLINLRSNGKITMRPRFDMGRVHDGFHAALLYSDSEAGSLYSQIIECLKAVDSTKDLPIFLSGHSLGGALVHVFAAALAQNHPDISARVSGLYTFGMPRVGDVAFSRAMEKCYPDCAFRITHAADIIPLVPPKFLEYCHFGEERYLTSLGREVVGDAAVRRARLVEAIGFLPLYLWKMGAGLVLNPKEGTLRTIYRLFMLVLLPGLNDHFPADYVYRLERLLKKS